MIRLPLINMVPIALVSACLLVSLGHTSDASPSEPGQSFVSDGKPIYNKEAGFAITPGKGWLVTPEGYGLHLVLEAPEKKHDEEAGVTYRPNVTLRVDFDAEPVDAIFAMNVSEMLTGMIAEISGAEDLVVSKDVNFVNFRGENDGLVVYSYFKLNGIPMGQAHLFLADKDRLFHLTYTDLESELQKDEVFESAWKLMSSMTILAPPAGRLEPYRGSIWLVFLTLFCLCFYAAYRSYHARKMVSDFERSLPADLEIDEVTEQTKCFLEADESFECQWLTGEQTLTNGRNLTLES